MKLRFARTAAIDDFLSVASVVAAGVMVLSLWWFKLSSIDAGYHIEYGRRFLETGQIVTLDPFLDPLIARPFINANWGTQVLMALIERFSGATGLIVLRWTLLAVIFTSIAVIVRRMTRGWHWLAWAWMLAALAAYERFSLRPELLGYAAMSVMLVVLVRGPKSWRSVAVLGVLQAVWVNLHGYFLVGLMLTGSILGGALLQGVSARRKPEPRVKCESNTRILALALAVQMAACFFNPWHVRGAVFPIQTVRYLQEQKVVGAEGDPTGGGPWAVISEFQQPFRFLFSAVNHRTIEAYCVVLAIALVGLMALFIRGRPGEGLAVALLLAMSVQMRRNIAPFAIVAVPLAVGGIAAAIPASWSRRRAAFWLRSGLLLATIFVAAGWTWSIVDGRFYYAERRIDREPGIGYSARFHPIDAARWLSARSAVQPLLFVDFFASSNMLPWLDRRFKLLVDTNTFAYEDHWLRQVMDVSAGRLDHRAFLQQHGVHTVVLHIGPETEPLVRALRTDLEWALVYVDPHAVIFLRRTPEHLPVLKTHQPLPENLDVAAWLKTAGGLRYHRALSVATMGGVPMTLGWYEPAARLFEEALRLAPDSPAAWYYLGLCHGNLADAAQRTGQADVLRVHLQEAIRCFRQALEVQPGDRVVRSNLSRAQELLKSAH